MDTLEAERRAGQGTDTPKGEAGPKAAATKPPASVYLRVVSAWPDVRGRPVAAFDFDSTLKEHRGRGPCELMTARALTHLARHYNVVVFSNRRAHSARGDSADAALEAYARRIGADFGETRADTAPNPVEGSVVLMGSLKHDRFRKPHRGMWEVYLQLLEAAGYAFTPRLRARSFYCGDAAGRPGDFAASDHAFARHCGIQFLVPELLFGGHSEPVPWRLPADCDPDAGYSAGDLGLLAKGSSGGASAERALAALEGARGGAARCLVILMGGQGSGKSTTARLLASKGFVVVSQEASRPAACLRKARAELGAACVAVDATHTTRAGRAPYLALAREVKARAIIVHMATPKRICMHLNAARCELDRTNKTEEVPIIAIHKTWKHMELPEKGEADAVVSVPFSLGPDAPPEVTDFRYP